MQIEKSAGLKNGDPAALDALRAWLGRTDLARIDALCFSEENAHDAQQWLDPLYDIVKEKGGALH